MIKRICTALIAVMIGAGAFTVPAFAYTGEDTGSAVPAVMSFRKNCFRQSCRLKQMLITKKIPWRLPSGS